MATVSRSRSCSKCRVELLNSHGVHMGIPFAYTFSDPRVLVCSKCYDDMTVDENKVTKHP